MACSSEAGFGAELERALLTLACLLMEGPRRPSGLHLLGATEHGSQLSLVTGSPPARPEGPRCMGLGAQPCAWRHPQDAAGSIPPPHLAPCHRHHWVVCCSGSLGALTGPHLVQFSVH